ncbi:EAL domain-containing protein [Proteobacteria bacterium 005FR1]|nr:EAL domain-containing protein [Proteobacteria bacterium 005FR1]
MNPNDTIRLLILNDSRKEAERLISMLRNAGRPSRAQHVESEEVLVKLLQEQTWDLLIGHSNTQSVPPSAAIKHIKRLSKDVPVILLSDEEGTQPIVEGLKMGAADVVRLDEDQHLLLVIQREMENHEQRQLRRRADRRFKEAEQRSQQLLDSSRDAIAYVQDGMYLYANESFAELFGYEDRDDIECMPIIDMIDDGDQEQVKGFMREFSLRGTDGESASLEFRGLSADGAIRPVTMEVANAIYDEEPCIQFLARARQSDNRELQAQINQIKHQDVTTGFYNRHYLVNRLQQSVNSAADSGATNALLTAEVDNFSDKIQPDLGVAASDQLLAAIAEIIRSECASADTLARFADNAFSILLTDTKADSALTMGEQLCRAIEEHIFDVDGRTVQVTLSVGVALINETASSADAVIEQSMKALHEVQAANRTEGVGNGAKLFEPQVSTGEGNDMGAAVRAALDKDQFRLLFQPIISLRGSEEEHYEVLLRMIADDGEEVSPHKFKEAAEQLGLHTKLDRWVILESIKLLSDKRANGARTQLIINLGGGSLQDDSLLPWLAVAFKAAKLPPQAITFQISEADVTNHLNAAKSLMQGLQKLGCGSAMSNFGCSLNPFKTLQHVSPDYVKVDGSFTLDVQNSEEGAEVLSNILKQLHEQKKITVVPFVENASVLSTLWQAGVHYIQGHYLQAPTPEMNYDFSMDS